MKELPPAFRKLAEGRALPEALEEAYPRHEGWLHAVGFVEDVELRMAAEAADVRRVFRGRWTLVALEGPLGGPYGVTLSRFDGERCEVLAGMLVQARSAGVSAVLLSAAGARPREEMPTAVEAKPVALRPAKPPAGAAGTSAWALRVGVSGAAREDDEDDVMQPERGDLVHHFAFGLCEVLSATGDRLTIRDLSGPGRLREVKSDLLLVKGPEERDGRRLFRLDRR